MRQSEGAVVTKYINQLEHRDISPMKYNLDRRSAGGEAECGCSRLRTELSVHDGGCADFVNL